MKLFEIDWQDFFQRLPVWQRLSPPARLAFAKMQPSQLQPLAKFNGEHHLLMESGFMTLERGGKKLRVNKDCWPFAATIRLMVNDDLLGNPGHAAMHKYVTYQLEVEQREALCREHGTGPLANGRDGAFGHVGPVAGEVPGARRGGLEAVEAEAGAAALFALDVIACALGEAGAATPGRSAGRR